jgi:hypothetical protein
MKQSRAQIAGAPLLAARGTLLPDGAVSECMAG